MTNDSYSIRLSTFAFCAKSLGTGDFTNAERHMPTPETKTVIYNTVFCGVCGRGKVLSVFVCLSLYIFVWVCVSVWVPSNEVVVRDTNLGIWTRTSSEQISGSLGLPGRIITSIEIRGIKEDTNITVIQTQQLPLTKDCYIFTHNTKTRQDPEKLHKARRTSVQDLPSPSSPRVPYPPAPHLPLVLATASRPNFL